jgi:hypothetical protein
MSIGKTQTIFPTTSQLKWRLMRQNDIQQVYDIANKVHLDFHEDIEIFEERQTLYPQGCFVLPMVDGVIVGYALCHPYLHNKSPPLNTLLKEIPILSNSWYIHDVAILQEFRGHGFARSIIQLLKVVAITSGYNQMTLTSVGNAKSFWIHQGFMADSMMTKYCATYGETAVFMRLNLLTTHNNNG